ncbi:MAG: Spy/CpxP family protein refolding chaperone [Desulfosoma sp.]
MNKGKTKILGLLGVLFLVVFGLRAEGYAFGFRGHGPGIFGPDRGGMFFQFLEKIVELKLTPEQQEKILEVLKKHRNEFEGAFQRVGAAHKKLNDVISQDNSTEAAVREAHKAAAAAQEDLAVLRAKVRREIMPLLTEEQRSKVQAWMQERASGPLGKDFPMPQSPKP